MINKINALINNYLKKTNIYTKIDEIQFTVKNINNICNTLSKTLINIQNKQEDLRFRGHYNLWRAKRIVAIINHYGEEFFREKKILELGAGYGDMGNYLKEIGAEVVFAEGRPEHCEVLRHRFPNNKVYQVNLENEWPWQEHFDIILNLGILYHLDNFNFLLEMCFAHCDHMILETEVSDSDDPLFVLKIEEDTKSYDQSLIGIGSRPSEYMIEAIIIKNNFIFKKINDDRCNSHFHRYDWKIKNTHAWINGQRRFWFIQKNSIQE